MEIPDKIKERFSRKKRYLVNTKKNPQSIVCRIPIEYYHEFEIIGKGNIKKGFLEALTTHYYVTAMNKDDKEGTDIKTEIMAKRTEEFLDDMATLFPKMASNHMSNFPAFIRVLCKGKWDPNILNKREKDDK